ncbi:GIY-YIG nuclease family protein [Mesorhizobium sp. M0933]|uniref:GIY-YIG nuclease family protein n=1 Tax=Mesorhizobium sp. M0933 TaxID=2957030 RepID=UPI00333A8880
MANPELNVDVLLNLGFVDIGRWVSAGEDIAYQLDGVGADANGVMLDVPNALYAFVRGDDVQYIGKTARSIRRRYVGYCRPGKRQRTNLRCHRNIQAAIGGGTEIRILAFTPISHLRYTDFEINLAAGLEDSLIKAFDPPWNGREKGQPITEEAEREEAEETGGEPPSASAEFDIQSDSGTSDPALASFTILLGPTYYKKGFLNPGVEASQFLGKDGGPIRVLFSDESVPVISKINRTANQTGAVRVVGRNQQIATWFQKHFKEGDVVRGRVIDAHTILLFAS